MRFANLPEANDITRDRSGATFYEKFHHSRFGHCNQNEIDSVQSWATEFTALARVSRSLETGMLFRRIRGHVASATVSRSAAQRFVSVHVLTPGVLTVKQGHDLLERLEKESDCALPNLTVSTHLEPLEDPASTRKH